MRLKTSKGKKVTYSLSKYQKEMPDGQPFMIRITFFSRV